MTITERPAVDTNDQIQHALDELLRNRPVQARSHARLNRLEAAARQALADPAIGRDRITTADVARISGCSIGTVYRYFPDRIAILDRIWPNRQDNVLDITALAEDAEHGPTPSLSLEEFDQVEHFGIHA
jgi:AcrR family transcriptional regulator